MPKLYLCHTCAQTFKVEVTNLTNINGPTFCPYCGACELELVKSSFDTLTARCFKGIPHELIQLLYEVWKLNMLGEQAQHPAFDSYLKERLRQATA